MEYSIACGDVIPGCAEQFEANSEDELLRRVAQHADAEHGIREFTPELLEAVKAAIAR